MTTVSGSARSWFIGALVAGCAFRIFLTASIPSYPTQAGVDDELYARNAAHILAGEWLGPYDFTTLCKEIGYPLFLAGAHVLGVPKRLAEDLLLCVAVLLVAWAMRRLGAGRTAACTAALLCLFSPATTSGLIYDIARQGISPAQVLIIIALSMVLVAPGTLRFRFAMSVPLGLVLAWFWHTREESIWILPCLLMFALTIVYVERARRDGFARGLLVACLLAAIPVMSVFAGSALLRWQNQRVYGADVECELKDRDFAAACGAVSRVTTAHWQRWQPLEKADRERLYELSPAFASLRKALEGEAFRTPGCIAADGEVTIHYYCWKIRQGASDGGHHASPAKARAFYRQLADEVNAACDSGAIAAGPRQSAEFPVLHPSLFGALSEKWCADFADLWRLRVPSCLTGPAQRARATGELAKLYAHVLREPERPRLVHSDVARFEILSVLQWFSGWTLPWLALGGAIGLLIQIVLIRVGRDEGWLGVQVALLIALFSLDFVNAVIQTYWWETWNTYYLAVYPLLPLVSVLAIAGAVRRISELAPINRLLTRAPRLPPVLRFATASAVILGAAFILAQAAKAPARITDTGIPIFVYEDIDTGSPPIRPILILDSADLDFGPEPGVGARLFEPASHILLRLGDPNAESKDVEIELDVAQPPPNSGVVLSWYSGEGPIRLPERSRTLPLEGTGTRKYRFSIGARGLMLLEIGLASTRWPARVGLKSVRLVPPT